MPYNGGPALELDSFTKSFCSSFLPLCNLCEPYHSVCHCFQIQQSREPQNTPACISCSDLSCPAIPNMAVNVSPTVAVSYLTFLSHENLSPGYEAKSVIIIIYSNLFQCLFQHYQDVRVLSAGLRGNKLPIPFFLYCFVSSVALTVNMLYH